MLKVQRRTAAIYAIIRVFWALVLHCRCQRISHQRALSMSSIYNKANALAYRIYHKASARGITRLNMTELCAGLLAWDTWWWWSHYQQQQMCWNGERGECGPKRLSGMSYLSICINVQGAVNLYYYNYFDLRWAELAVSKEFNQGHVKPNKFNRKYCHKKRVSFSGTFACTVHHHFAGGLMGLKWQRVSTCVVWTPCCASLYCSTLCGFDGSIWCVWCAYVYVECVTWCALVVCIALG